MHKANWTQVRLSKICDVDSGAGFPLRYQGLKDKKYPFFKVGDMNTPGNELEMRIYQHSISEETRQELGARAFPPGTIVFPKIGAAIATNKKRILTKPSCVDNNVMAVIPSESISGTFLYYLFVVTNLSGFASTGNPPSIRKSTIEAWKISLPPLPEQQRIAAILAKADRLRRLRRTARDVSDTYLQSVFLEMFGDPVSNPMGWARATVGDVVAVSQYGTSKKSNSEQRGYPVLGMGNITYLGRIDLTSLSYVELSEEEFEALRLVPGDIIFNRTNSTELVGKTAQWNCKFDAVLASYLVKLKLKKKVLPDYFTALLNTRYYKRLFQERCKKAVGQSNISPTLLKEFPMLVPPLPLQQEFAKVVQKFERLRAQQREAQRQAEHLFQTLLHRAFRGEV